MPDHIPTEQAAPVTLAAAGRQAGEIARSLHDGLARAGIDARRRRLPRRPSGDWLVTNADVPDRSRPELVVVGDEDTRTGLERRRPDLVGDVWVWNGEDAGFPGLLARRYRPAAPPEPVRVGVVGYNLKFFRPIEQHLRRLPSVEVREAEWPKYAVASSDTEAVVDWASVIFCEWAGQNAVVASRRRRPDQRLYVRLHRFELERDDWREIDIQAVDRVIAVGEPYRRRILEVTGWPDDKVVVVPNLLDIAQLDRPKLEESALTVGLLGAVPWRKRPDRALDVLGHLRETDPAWRLRIKGDRPEDERWVRDSEEQAARYGKLDRRIDQSGGAVSWDMAGPDVAAWFRQVGHILSTSEEESFHLAPAEGMASGATPVVWPWFGAGEIYDGRWIENDPAAAAEAILSRRDTDRESARAEVAHLDRDRVLPVWERLLLSRP